MPELDACLLVMGVLVKCSSRAMSPLLLGVLPCAAAENASKHSTVLAAQSIILCLTSLLRVAASSVPSD